uniref:hypothetical protein n=1 Tax=Nocardia neocaledoniensis TaxID=236511 RepID=UPI002456AEC5
SLGSGGGDVQSMIFTGVTFLIGLGAVVLLWQPRSAAFFAPQRVCGVVSLLVPDFSGRAPRRSGALTAPPRPAGTVR